MNYYFFTSPTQLYKLCVCPRYNDMGTGGNMYVSDSLYHSQVELHSHFTELCGVKQAFHNDYYEIVDVFNTVPVFQGSLQTTTVNTLIVSSRGNDILTGIEWFSKSSGINKNIWRYNVIADITVAEINKNEQFDFIFYDMSCDTLQQFKSKIIQVLVTVLQFQTVRGTCVLKINVMDAISFELLYALSEMYEIVYIYRPRTSVPSAMFVKYIVCRYRKPASGQQEKEVLLSCSGNYTSLFGENAIPCTFINKIVDIYIKIGNGQLVELHDKINMILDLQRNQNTK